MRIPLIPFFCLLILGGFFACQSDRQEGSRDTLLSENAVDTTMAMADTAMSKDTAAGVMVGGAILVPAKNIMENLAASKDHTRLLAALKTAGLDKLLRGRGPFTVLAPTNAAFDNFAQTGDQANKLESADLLNRHIVAGYYKAEDLKDGLTLRTLTGHRLKITLKDGNWWADSARITIPDVISSNGVILVADHLTISK